MENVIKLHKNILITGGAGYIGSVTVPLLLAQGHRVTVVDRFYFGEHTLPEHPRLTKIKLDTRALTRNHFENVDAVIDFAAMSNDPCGEAFSELTWEINHRTRVRTARLAKQAGVQHYILPSSCSVYGFQEGIVDESSPTNPLTVYAKANLAAEQDILPLTSKSFTVTVLRLATVFGLSPRMRLDLVVNSMVYSAWKNGEIMISGGGQQVRPLIHVQGIAHILAQLLKLSANSIQQHNIFNIGNCQQNFTINQVAQHIADTFQRRGLVSPMLYHNGPQDLRSYHVNFEKISNLLPSQKTTTVPSGGAEIMLALANKTFVPSPWHHTLDWYNKIFSRIEDPRKTYQLVNE